MGDMRLPVAVNRARRASCCEQGELRVELSGRQPCPTTSVADPGIWKGGGGGGVTEGHFLPCHAHL